MEIWRLATCGHGWQRSSFRYIIRDGRIQLIKLEIVDMQWRKSKKSAKFRVWDKASEESILIFGDTQIPLQHNE